MWKINSKLACLMGQNHVYNSDRKTIYAEVNFPEVNAELHD